jgi:hemerythrin
VAPRITKLRRCAYPRYSRAMQPILPWSDTFAVGHAGLDAEHRHQVELINKIGFAVQEKQAKELVDLLKTFERLAAEHFRHENAILREIQSGTYAPLRGRDHILKPMAAARLETHIAEHDALLSRLHAIIAGPVGKLCDDLKAWFVDHVQDYETDLKSLFQTAA